MALLYRKLMDALYLVCVVVAGTALVLISAVIPWAVFTRYVLNSAASWPEPTAVLLTIVLTFIGAAACYRRRLHMNVSFFVQMFPPPLRMLTRAFGRAPGRHHGAVHDVYGEKLVAATWYNTIADFPSLSVGVTYLPIPVGGALLLLFVIERVVFGMPPDPEAIATFTERSDTSQRHGCRHSAGHDVLLLLHRRADRLFAGARRDRRRLVDRHSARSGDAENLRRRQQGRHADHPVLRARRRHHGRRRHGAPPGRLRRRAGRLYPRARRPVGGQCARHDLSQRHFRLRRRRHLGDRLGDDPADGESRLPPRLRHQRHHHRFGAGAAGAAEPQRGDLFARHRRHDFDHLAVHGRRRAGAAARLFADRALPRHRLPRQPSARPDRAAARGGEDHHRRAVGPDHARHHFGRHFGRRIHRHRGRRGGLRLGLPGHHVHLSRLSLARSAERSFIARCAPSPWC